MPPHSDKLGRVRVTGACRASSTDVDGLDGLAVPCPWLMQVVPPQPTQPFRPPSMRGPHSRSALHEAAEDGAHGLVVQALAAIEHHAQQRHRLGQVLGGLRLACVRAGRKGGEGQGTGPHARACVRPCRPHKCALKPPRRPAATPGHTPVPTCPAGAPPQPEIENHGGRHIMQLHLCTQQLPVCTHAPAPAGPAGAPAQLALKNHEGQHCKGVMHTQQQPACTHAPVPAGPAGAPPSR